MKKDLLIPLLTMMPIIIHAQQNLGIRNSNYAGIQGALLNPSSIADSRLSWDVNVFSGATTFDNTFLYIPKDSLKLFGVGKIINDILHEEDWITRYDKDNPNELFNFTFSQEVF